MPTCDNKSVSLGMKALKYSCMILLSVFISCDSDDDDDHDHDHDPNWSYRLQQPQDPPQQQDIRLTAQRPPLVQHAS
jgi:hypothetical protein